MELNMREYAENQMRRQTDYYQGVPYVENPPYVDYSQEPPYQPGMLRHPTPQVHGSMRVPSEYTKLHIEVPTPTGRHRTSIRPSSTSSHRSTESHQEEGWRVFFIEVPFMSIWEDIRVNHLVHLTSEHSLILPL
ncbi:hypothetical protein Hanom_Chr17g01575811 [Helianthus anomalus]